MNGTRFFLLSHLLVADALGELLQGNKSPSLEEMSVGGLLDEVLDAVREVVRFACDIWVNGLAKKGEEGWREGWFSGGISGGSCCILVVAFLCFVLT